MARNKSRPRKNAKRRVTAKKRAPKRKRTKSTTPQRVGRSRGTGGSHSAHYAVMRNPFSKATQQAKIPDGQMVTSLSRKLQAVKEIINQLSVDNTSNEINILICPHIGLGFMARGIDGQLAGSFGVPLVFQTKV